MTGKFEYWMKRVDDELNRKCGLMSDDLPDMDYWDMWESGRSPLTAALLAIRDAETY